MKTNLNLVIDKLAPLKDVHSKKKYAPWFGPELRQLVDKRYATHIRYKRTGRAALLGEFLRLSNEVEVCISQERNSYLHKQLTDVLDANKGIWKEMRNLGLLPKRKEENLHGCTPTQLNTHFAGISLSPVENIGYNGIY